jgi:HMG (high mobility group) box
MLFRTAVRRAASPYLVFIKKSYKNPALKKELSALSIPKRGKLMGKMWRSLPRKEKAAIVAEAKKTKLKRKPAPKKRKATPYAKFVKAQSKAPGIKGLPARERFVAIAKKWAQQ